MGHAVGGYQQPSIPAMERDDAPTGRHALGPHVVGLRVVVRRVLPGETGPTGGPAMTDVLGVCEAWGGGVATLRRDISRPVRRRCVVLGRVSAEKT